MYIFHQGSFFDLFLQKNKDPYKYILVVFILLFSAYAWYSIVSFPECFLNIFNHIVILSSDFQAPPRGCLLQAVRPKLVVLLVPTVDAARALTIMTNLSLDFPLQHQQVAMTKVSTWDFGILRFFLIVASFGAKLNFPVSSRSCKTVWRTCVVNMTQSKNWLAFLEKGIVLL